MKWFQNKLRDVDVYLNLLKSKFTSSINKINYLIYLKEKHTFFVCLPGTPGKKYRAL